mgnify:FL=1|tara:strand:+ start:97 stop:249 length:153 start_codon:yes stop_codon:yes gene_type:complete
MMTRKHFVRIAEILLKNGIDEVTIEDFCNYFVEENPNFDVILFRKAAGII